jgi:hypothetical protein
MRRTESEAPSRLGVLDIQGAPLTTTQLLKHCYFVMVSLGDGHKPVDPPIWSLFGWAARRARQANSALAAARMDAKLAMGRT